MKENLNVSHSRFIGRKSVYLFLIILTSSLVVLAYTGVFFTEASPEIELNNVIQPAVKQNGDTSNKLIAPANIGVKP